MKEREKRKEKKKVVRKEVGKFLCFSPVVICTELTGGEEGAGNGIGAKEGCSYIILCSHACVWGGLLFSSTCQGFSQGPAQSESGSALNLGCVEEGHPDLAHERDAAWHARVHTAH